ncbi:hypothetical protein C0J52_11638 [Blattella germanica]|nr:hypothetical protein C0J52_11638 [Blattella germanica]
MAMMEDNDAWQQLFVQIKQNHDEAYHIIDKAIKLEEEGKRVQAFDMYEIGLVLIDKALSIPMKCPSDPDISWEKASVMIQKMKKTRKEILCRLSDAQVTSEPSVVSPPSYEEAMACPRSGDNSLTDPIVTYNDLGLALQNLKVETGAQAAKILYTQENVRLYFISLDGSESPSPVPEILRIVELEDDDSSGDKPRAYLQVGGWIYPLVPGVSPCYQSDRTTFIFPDVHSSVEDDSVCELLNDILQGIVSKTPVAYGAPSRSTGYRYSRGIVKGAQYISYGLIKGAEKTGELMNYGTPKLIQKITPDPVPTAVNPRTQGTKILSSTCNLTQQEASKKMEGVLEVAAGAVEGFSTVYEGLERSAGILASSLANNTVKIVEHKYGHSIGGVTDDTLHTVGNVFVAGNNIRHLTPKGIAKVTAKSTGKAVIEDYRKSLKEDDNQTNGPGPSSSS